MKEKFKTISVHSSVKEKLDNLLYTKRQLYRSYSEMIDAELFHAQKSQDTVPTVSTPEGK